jgi:hypothetical protein
MKQIFSLVALLVSIHFSYSQKYEYAPGKYQTFKFTEKVDTITINKKLSEGKNMIGKTTDGDINAIVKNGSMVKFTMTESSGKEIVLNSPPPAVNSNVARTSLTCMHCWVARREGQDYYICNDVPCKDKSANAVRQVNK